VKGKKKKKNEYLCSFVFELREKKTNKKMLLKKS